jgi:hypothetical protein
VYRFFVPCEHCATGCDLKRTPLNPSICLLCGVHMQRKLNYLLTPSVFVHLL